LLVDDCRNCRRGGEMKRERISTNALESTYRNCRTLSLFTVLFMATAALAYGAEDAVKSSANAGTHSAASMQVPAYFEPNEGQFPAAVNFVARMPGYTAWFTRKELILSAGDPKHQAKLRMQLVGGGGELIGEDRLPGKVNYFVGSDSTKWHRGVPIYGRIMRRYAYPGIDVVYRIEGAEIEYDLIVAPDADPNRIKLHFDGAKRVRIDSTGDLVLSTTAGEIRQRKPTVYQESSSGLKALDGHFVLEGKGRVGFELAHYDRSKALVIDPSIAYSTYVGGTGLSAGTSLAIFTDPLTGRPYVYVTGDTGGNDFPITPNALQQTPGGGTCSYPCNNAFIAKFDPAASGGSSLLYSTYLGGGTEHAAGIAVDSAGNAYVVGATGSTNFPVVNGYQAAIKHGPCYLGATSGAGDSFLAKLSSDGSALLYSTYFGGTGCDYANAIALDSVGHAYVAGSTASLDLPLMNPLQTSPQTAFLAIFDPNASGSASLLYSSYIGGSGLKGFYPNPSPEFGFGAYGIAVDTGNTVHIGGITGPNFPVLNGFQTGIAGGGNFAAFYARLNPAASGLGQLLYSTYLGGASICCANFVSGVAVDASGNTYLTGQASSPAFPTTSGSYLPQPPTHAPSWFAAKINPSSVGSASLIYSTFVPAFNNGSVAPSSIAVDGGGDAFVSASAGGTVSLLNPAQSAIDGVLQSVDGGTTWSAPANPPSEFPITALAIDTSTSPRTLYAGTGVGSIFASSDGGLNWNRVFGLQPGTVPCNLEIQAVSSTSCVLALAVDPSTPSTIYAGTSSGFYESMDRGTTWATLNTGFANSPEFVNDLVVDVEEQQEHLYAGTADGLYKFDSGTMTWIPTAFTANVHHIIIDPSTTPHTIYVTVDIGSDHQYPQGGIHKSVNGGNTWTSVQVTGSGCPNLLAVDTSVTTSATPAELYVSDSCATYGSPSFFVSTDGGNTWLAASSTQSDPYSGNLADSDTILKVDSATSPSTIYYASPSQGGFFTSRDHGNTWLPTSGQWEVSFGTIAIDPSTATQTSPSVVYAGSGFLVQRGFIVELNPAGSALLFSTYAGGMLGNTFSKAIGLDDSGNIYITGSTDSRFFPFENGYASFIPFPATISQQPSIAFLMKLGSQTLPPSSSNAVSTHVGVQTGTLTITLPNITGSTTNSAPTLTVTPLSSAQTADVSLSSNLGAYDISTTASFSGSVKLCFQALTVNDPTTFSNLQLFHIVNGTLVDVTSSRDFSTKTVCGTVTSLSPFVLFSPSTSTAVSSTLNPSTFGQSVTFTANVVAAGAATGTVTFRDGSTVLATVPLSSGQASLNTSALTAGSHSITASYSGDMRFLGSTSAVLVEMVNKAQTATAVSTSVTPSIFNQGVTLTATVGAISPESAISTGTVTFKDGNATLGTGNLSSGTATFTTSLLAVGSHSISAVYVGDSNFIGSTSVPSPQQVQYEPAGTTCLGAPGHQILQPINADGTSVWKQGRTIPAQFRVCDANGVSVGSAGVISSFSLTQIISGTVTNIDESVSSTSADSAFHWDATNQQWIFNISTKSLTANNTYVYTVGLNDGTTIIFKYGLK
jgi:hypothetical protein